MIRFFDITFALVGLILLSPIMIILFILGYFDTGEPLFLQVRLGLNKKPFKLIKFRSMHLNTQEIATHKVELNAITKWGTFLRKSKLDELPQLFNVLFGDMSFVGPRPNLFSQLELIEARFIRGVYNVRPGITGLAQINKIDMSMPQLLAETDEKMIKQLDLIHYFKYIILTIFGKGFGDRVKK